MPKKNHSKQHVCPWWFCFTFDNPLRQWLNDREKLLRPYVLPGSTAADIGCGMGHFTLGLARLVGPNGRVIAADLQPQMLAQTQRRLRRARLADRLTTCQVTPERLDLPGLFDFILASWMVHEVDDKTGFFSQVRSLLAPAGRFLMIEPRMHISEFDFEEEIEIARTAGLEEVERPAILISRAVLMRTIAPV